jgi:predicted dehydrogenase
MYGDVPGVVTVSQGVGTRVIQTEIADQYLLEFDSFAQALIEKNEVPTPIQDGINNMAVIDALFASASSGKWEAVAKL